MEWYKLYLLQEYASRKALAPNYSLRSFARFLNLDASTLSKIMKGKAALGIKSARRICEELRLNPVAKHQFLNSILGAKTEKKSSLHYNCADNMKSTM